MLPNSSQVLLYHKPIDMRKGINGLSVMVAMHCDLILGMAVFIYFIIRIIINLNFYTGSETVFACYIRF